LNQGVFEKTLEKRMKKYTNPELLVVDEMGYAELFIIPKYVNISLIYKAY